MFKRNVKGQFAGSYPMGNYKVQYTSGILETLAAWFKKLLVVGFAIGILYSAFVIGSVVNPVITYAVKEVPVKDTSLPPVLIRIAQFQNCQKQFKIIKIKSNL